jgi:hypothetical protein
MMTPVEKPTSSTTSWPPKATEELAANPPGPVSGALSSDKRRVCYWRLVEENAREVT